MSKVLRTVPGLQCLLLLLVIFLVFCFHSYKSEPVTPISLMGVKWEDYEIVLDGMVIITGYTFVKIHQTVDFIVCKRHFDFYMNLYKQVH